MARVHYVKHARQRYEMVSTDVVTPVMRRDGTQKVTKSGKAVTRRASAPDKTKPLPNLKCGKCGVEIKVGDPYKWVKVKRTYGGVTYYRCASCPRWRQSELSNSKMSGVYAAQERCDDEVYECTSVGELESLRDELAEEIRNVGEEYGESADNMEDGFGHETYQSAELREKAEALDGWADEIESTDFDEFDEDEVDGDEDDETREDDIETARDEWIEEQRDKLSSIIQECPV
jgi:hypothetical protein